MRARQGVEGSGQAGGAWLGAVRQYAARLGKAGQDRQGTASLGQARLGRHGEIWRGEMKLLDRKRQAGTGKAGHGLERLGTA